MRSEVEIEARLEELRARRAHFLTHAAHTLDMEDFHGVQDAGSDLRDIDHEIQALEWVLDELES